MSSIDSTHSFKSAVVWSTYQMKQTAWQFRIHLVVLAPPDSILTNQIMRNVVFPRYRQHRYVLPYLHTHIHLLCTGLGCRVIIYPPHICSPVRSSPQAVCLAGAWHDAIFPRRSRSACCCDDSDCPDNYQQGREGFEDTGACQDHVPNFFNNHDNRKRRSKAKKWPMCMQRGHFARVW